MRQPGEEVLEIVSKGQLSSQEQVEEGVKVSMGEVVDLEVAVVVIVAEKVIVS